MALDAGANERWLDGIQHRIRPCDGMVESTHPSEQAHPSKQPTPLNETYASAPAPPPSPRAWRLWAAAKGRGRPTGLPATTSGARASRLQSRRLDRGHAACLYTTISRPEQVDKLNARFREQFAIRALLDKAPVQHDVLR